MKRILLTALAFFLPLIVFASTEYLSGSNQPVKNDLMIPSPIEMIIRGKALNVEIGSTTLQDLLKHKYTASNKVQSTIYLGRTMAAVSLGLEKMSDRTLGLYLLKIKEGLTALDIPERYLDQYEGLRLKFQELQISKNDLMEELDMAFTSLGSRIGGSNDSMMFRVLQGSAWVQAQNLLAKAMITSEKYQFAKKLLSQPEITTYIIQVLNDIKRSKGPASNIDGLIASVQEYRKATEKSHLKKSDIEKVIRVTDSFLASY